MNNEKVVTNWFRTANDTGMTQGYTDYTTQISSTDLHVPTLERST